MRKTVNLSNTYHAIHKWARRTFGQPTECELCHKKNLTGRYIHWASRRHKYTRHRKDWVRVCAKCHLKYDKRKPMSMLGKHHSVESINKIKKALTGKNNPFFGKCWDDYGGHPKGMLGKKHSKATRLKMTKSLIIRWKNKK